MFIRVQKLTAIVAVSIFLLCLALPPGFAHQPLSTGTTGLPHHASMNLNSTSSTSAGHLIHSTPVNITVGGVVQAVTATTSVTPAERIAVYQMLSSGHQSLVVGALGNAIGGSFTIGPHLAQHISNLVIPQGVTAIANLGSSGLNLKGNLVDAGTLLAVSNNPAVTVANITAANIINKTGGLITTVLPSSGLAGYTNLNSALSLNLNALNNIINAGTISSAASLSLNAGGSITNAAGSAVGSPALLAAGSVNLMSGAGNIINSGLIAAAAGNINVASQSVQSITFNNAAGTLQALAGNINVRDPSYSGSANVWLSGGKLLSKELNLYSGNGNITVDADQISGAVNAQGNAAHVTSNSGELTLGNIDLTGDPTFYSTDATHGITLGGNITSGEALSIVSAGSITASTDLTITTTGSTGFDINLIAGANITSSTGTTSSTVGPGSGTSSSWTGPGSPAGPITISSTGGAGGNIDFSSHNVTISTGTNAGGNVRLIAFANGNTGGQVLLSSGSSVTANGSGGGTDGNVTILAGGSGYGTVITTGAITTTGGGSLTISNAAPTFKSGTSMTFNADGSIADGNDFIAGTPGSGAVLMNGVVGAGGTVTVGGGSIQINNNVTADGALTLNLAASAIGSSISIGTSVAVTTSGIFTANMNLVHNLPTPDPVFTNNGTIQSNASSDAGSPGATILIQNTLGNLALAGTGSLVQGGPTAGDTVFNAAGNITFQSGTGYSVGNVGAGGSVVFYSPQIQVTSSTAQPASAVIISSGISGYTLNSSYLCTSCPLAFQASGSATSASLQLLGAPVATGASNGATSNPVSNVTIGANFNLYSDSDITINSTPAIAGGSATVNIAGQLSSYPTNSGGSVTIQSPGNLIIVGSGQIQTNGTGTVSFLAMAAGKSLTIGDSTNTVATALTTANVGTVNFRTPNLIFAGTDAAAPSFAAYPGLTNTAINIDSGNSAANVDLTITVPAGTVGTNVSTSTGGAITVAPTGTGALTFVQSGSGTSFLSFNGAQVVINETNSVRIGSGVAVYCDTGVVVNMNTASGTPAFTNNGFLENSNSGANIAGILIQNTLGNLNLAGQGGFLEYGTVASDTVFQAKGSITFANLTNLTFTSLNAGGNAVFNASQLLVDSQTRGSGSAALIGSSIQQFILNPALGCTSCSLTFGLSGSANSATLSFSGAPVATATTNAYTANAVSDITVPAHFTLTSLDNSIILNSTPAAPATSTTITINGIVSAQNVGASISIQSPANLQLGGMGSILTDGTGNVSINASNLGTTSLNITTGSNLSFGFGAVQITATQISIPSATTVSSNGDIIATTSQFTNDGALILSNNNLTIAPVEGPLTIAGNGSTTASGIIIGGFGGFSVSPPTPTASMILYSGKQNFASEFGFTAFTTITGGTVQVAANSVLNVSAPVGLVFDATNVVNNGAINFISCGCSSGIVFSDSLSGSGINISGTGSITSSDGILVQNSAGPISFSGTQKLGGPTQILDSAFRGINILPGAQLTTTQGLFMGTNALSNQGTITSTGVDNSGTGMDIESGPRGISISGPGAFISAAGPIVFVNNPSGRSQPIQFSGNLTLSAPSVQGTPSVIIADLANKGVIFNSGSTFTVTGGNGQLYVTSPPTADLNVAGTGTMTAPLIVLVGSNTGGNLNLSSTGTLTLAGSSFLSSVSGSINITSGTVAHTLPVSFNARGTIPSGFSPATGINQINPPTTPPALDGSTISILTDPLTVNGSIVAIAGPSSPSSPPAGLSNAVGNRFVLFGQVSNNNNGDTNVQIGTRTATDYTPSTVYGWTNGSITGIPENAHAGHASINAAETSSSNFNEGTVSGFHGVHAGSGTNGSFFNLDTGNMVFNPHSNITVGTHDGNVFIDGGSIAFVMETGHDVAVYDLHDTHHGAVRVAAGNQTIILHPGQQVVLTRNSTADFEKINPGGKISYRHSRSQDVGGGIKAFLADFSVPTALSTVAPLKQMLSSTNPSDRKIAHQLLKNAVILSETTAANGPYRNGI